MTSIEHQSFGVCTTSYSDVANWHRMFWAQLRNDSGQLVHTLMPLSQSSLVPVNRRWHFGTGNLSVGLALHWPCITDFNSK